MSITTFEMKTSKQRRGKEQEADRKARNYSPTELTRNNIAARVYNYIQDEDKGKERHVVAPYLLLELTRNNIAARVYNYIRDEDKQEGENKKLIEKHVVAPYLLLELTRNNIATTTFEMKTSKRARTRS